MKRNELYEKIYQSVMMIPRGRVATYGDIAWLSGNANMARLVGNALHANPYPGEVPCHRVVNSQGRLADAFAFGGSNKQRELLLDEGVRFVGDKVDMALCRWDVRHTDALPLAVVPPLLSKGDRVALAATARKVSPEELAAAIELLGSWGLDVVVPDGLYNEHHQLAGTDDHRALLFQRLIDDPTIKAIFCARGGYGTVRMADKLNWDSFRAHPKWIVGYSDVTVLHSLIHNKLNISTLHAIMPINIHEEMISTPTPATLSLRQYLFNGKIDYPQLCLPSPHFRSGKARGMVVGGNLSMLYSQLASASDIDTTDKILFIEDLDEYLYHIDRMMMALLRSGKLSNIKGLIVGAMSHMHDNTIPFGETAEEIVMRIVAPFHYPVATHAKIGHIEEQNLSLPLGVEMELTVDEHGNASLVRR